MGQAYNIYCDESCHLEHDHLGVMVLGAVWCPTDKAREVMTRIKEIKARHGVPALTEVKWVKVSRPKLALYLELIDYFFDDDDLHFRSLIVQDKGKLNHVAFQQEHDDWYFKMYFDMIKVILDPRSEYRIFLDIKDTRSATKVAKLHEVLCNNMYDFRREQGLHYRRPVARFPASRAAAVVRADNLKLRGRLRESLGLRGG